MVIDTLKPETREDGSHLIGQLKPLLQRIERNVFGTAHLEMEVRRADPALAAQPDTIAALYPNGIPREADVHEISPGSVLSCLDGPVDLLVEHGQVTEDISFAVITGDVQPLPVAVIGHRHPTDISIDRG
jgi:hypothetical protein